MGAGGLESECPWTFSTPIPLSRQELKRYSPHGKHTKTQQPNLAELLACDDDVDLPLERVNIQLRPIFSGSLTIGNEPQAHQPHNATISQKSR